jgi:pilus assembly protein CpaC
MTRSNLQQLARAVCICLTLLSAEVLALTSPPPDEILTVSEGQSLLLGYTGVTRVAVGDGELLEVRVFKESNEILLIARKPGVTDLRLWTQGDEPARYLVQVHGEIEYVSELEIQKLLDGVEGIDVSTVGKTVIIQGRATTESDLTRIDAITDRYPTVYSYVEEPVFERKPTILMQAHLLEVRRTALKDIGISWSNFINGPTFGLLSDFTTNPFFRLTAAPAGAAATLPLDAGTQAFSGISTSLSSTINLLVENDDARVLAEPTLACISGGQADFLVGGELPIPVRGDFGTVAVEFKEFGIILKFAPLADADRFIRTELNVEVSSVDRSIEVLGIPGFVTRKTNTQMNVAEGQTMVIAGLVNSEDAKNVEKVPLLGDIPILGELFKSRQFLNQQTELVILMTPQIIDAESKQNQNYRETFDLLADESAERVKFNIMD